MAIMHKMRENTHIILFFLLIMFVASMTIGGLVGGANVLDLLSGRKSDTILSVNGEQISYEQYQRAYNSQLESLRQEKGEEPTSYEIQRIEEQVWQQIIQEILQSQEIKKKNLYVTKEELKYFMITNPHPIFRMNENFQDENKQFDFEKYQAALNSPENDNIWRYYQQYLSMMIPNEKLQNEVVSTVRVTDEEIKERYVEKNQKIKVSYVLFDPTKYDITDEQVTDKEVKKYYNEHEQDYQEEEKRRIKYVLFSTSPTAKDSLETMQLAESLLDSAKSGTNFAELASTYSDDVGSAAKGGDLGFFGKGAMVKPFEEAAFAAKVGEIVGPVKSSFGIHIIKVEEKKKEDGEDKVKASHILLKYKASRETQENAREFANYFADNAADDGFIAATKIDTVKIDTTDFFTNSGFIPNLGVQKRIALKAFNMKQDEVSRVFYIEERGYIVFQVYEIQEKRIKPLDEVKSSIVSKIKREKQMKLAEKDAYQFREKITNPDDFKTIATQDSVEIKTTDFFTLDQYIPGLGRDPMFNGTAFGLYEKEISKPAEGARGFYVIKMEKQEKPFDENDFNSQKEQIKQELLNEKRRNAFNDWLAALKEQASIKDYRYMFF